MSLLSAAQVFFAQAPAPATDAPQPPGLFGGLLVPMLLMAGAMYFFMIAPQNRKAKEHAKLIASLGSGDEILTTSGIYGTITNVKDDRFVVRIADNTKIEIGRAFVQTVIKKTS